MSHVAGTHAHALASSVACGCRSMRQNYSQRRAYNYDEVRLDDKGKPVARPAHPVTVKAKRVLKAIIDLLELPANPLDHLVHLCGGREVVAEMTGRKDMMEMQADGSFRAVRRATSVKGVAVPQQQLNLDVRPPPVSAPEACMQLNLDGRTPLLPHCVGLSRAAPLPPHWMQRGHSATSCSLHCCNSEACTHLPCMPPPRTTALHS
jgi:hypothetical protein